MKNIKTEIIKQVNTYGVYEDDKLIGTITQVTIGSDCGSHALSTVEEYGKKDILSLYKYARKKQHLFYEFSRHYWKEDDALKATEMALDNNLTVAQVKKTFKRI